MLCYIYIFHIVIVFYISSHIIKGAFFMNEWYFLLFIHCWGWCCCVGVWFWNWDVTYFLHFEHLFNTNQLNVEQLSTLLLFFLPNQQVRMFTNEPNIVDFCTNIGEILSKLVWFLSNIDHFLSFFTLAMVLFQV